MPAPSSFPGSKPSSYSPRAEPASNPADNPFLNVALTLVRQGFHVHPLKAKSKKPRLKSFGPNTGWRVEATTREPVLRVWWRRWPDSNPGIRTGVEAGIFMLDVDKRHGNDRALRDLEAKYQPLPSTWTIETPDGWRPIFRHPGGYLRGEIDGILLIGDGNPCNAVGPGAVNEKGERYAWVEGFSPADVSLADPPAFFLKLLYERGLWIKNPSKNPHRASEAPKDRESLSTRIEGGEKYTCTIVREEGPLRAKGRMTPRELAALGSNWEVVQQLFPVLGIPQGVKPGENFPCVLHPERKASAVILPPQGPERPYFVYGDMHAREGGREIWPLTNVYHARETGKRLQDLKDMGKESGSSGEPAFVLWTARMYMKAGILPTPPAMRSLREAVPPKVERARKAIWEIRWLRSLLKFWDAMPLAERFVADWAGVGRDTVRRAKELMLRLGELLKKGIYKLMPLYLLAKDALMLRHFKPRVWKRLQQEEPDRSMPLEESVQAVSRGPCSQCGRTVYDPDACGQCLKMAQERLDRKRRELREREGPLVEERPPDVCPKCEGLTVVIERGRPRCFRCGVYLSPITTVLRE